MEKTLIRNKGDWEKVLAYWMRFDFYPTSHHSLTLDTLEPKSYPFVLVEMCLPHHPDSEDTQVHFECVYPDDLYPPL